jgi:hypothetical protein
LLTCVPERDRGCPLAEQLVPFPLVCPTRRMRPPAPHRDQGYRVPAEMIRHGVWLSSRLCLRWHAGEALRFECGSTGAYAAMVWSTY